MTIKRPQVEEWLPVVGFESWYEVSNWGRVKRVKASKSTRVGKYSERDKANMDTC